MYKIKLHYFIFTFNDKTHDMFWRLVETILSRRATGVIYMNRYKIRYNYNLINISGCMC